MTLQDTLNKMKEMGFEQDAIEYAELQLKQNNIEFASKLMELMVTLKIGQDIFDVLDEKGSHNLDKGVNQ